MADDITAVSLTEQRDSSYWDKFWRVMQTISVEPLLLLYMICLYYLIPTANSLYLYKVCRTVHEFDEDVCESLVRANITANLTEEEHLVSTDTANWMFYQTVVFTIPSTIVTLTMGLYADKHGRRIPLIMPFVGQGLGCCYYLLMSVYKTLHVEYMLVGAFLTGISGGYACIIMACNSHLSVIIPLESLTFRLVVLQSVATVGNLIGSFTVGYINSPETDLQTGWIATYATIVGITVVGLIYIVIRFWNVQYPSTYASIEPGGGDSNVCRSINVMEVLYTVCHHFPSVLQLLFIAIWLAWVEGLGEFDVLYSYAQRMGLNLAKYADYNGCSAGVQAVAGAISVFIFKGIFHMRDTYVALIGLISGAAELLLLGISGFVGSGTLAFAVLWWSSPAAGMFKMVAPNALSAVASSLVKVSDQSKLFSFISASDGILQLATSALYNYVIWHFTEENVPSLGFFVSLALTLLSAALTVVIEWMLRLQSADHHDDEPILLSESDS